MLALTVTVTLNSKAISFYDTDSWWYTTISSLFYLRFCGSDHVIKIKLTYIKKKLNIHCDCDLEHSHPIFFTLWFFMMYDQSKFACNSWED